jgi:hypothetical protein
MRPSPSFTQFLPLFAAALLAPTCLLTAQNRGPQHRDSVEQSSPDFYASMGFSGGQWDHETRGSALDDDTDAWLFRFRFEGNNSRGVGGGFRFEYVGSDDDLFQGTGFARSEARVFSGFLHFTYRVEARRFTMPLRVGLMTNYYTLEEVATDDQVKYLSIGPYFEFAPELVLAGRRQVQWSLYGEFGGGFGFTGIKVDGDSNDYYSTTWLSGVEAGMRFRFGPVEIGAAYVGRWQWMDDSESEGNNFVFGYDADYHGFLFTMGARF